MTSKVTLEEPLSAPNLEGTSENKRYDPSHTLGSLYEAHNQEITSYIKRQFGEGPPEPEDVTQIAFQKLAERRSLQAIQNVVAYLKQTARNLVLTELTKAETRERYTADIEEIFFSQKGSETDPETVLQHREQLAIVIQALGAMPTKRRRAFMLHRIEGKSMTETGRQLGISRTAVRKHVCNAMSAIDKAMANSGRREGHAE